jgi:hypothetical protein
MFCLFADLLLSLLQRTSKTHSKPHKISPRGLCPASKLRANAERFAIRYRDCNSNPKIANLAAILSRRCQPLVTRIPYVSKFDAPNR